MKTIKSILSLIACSLAMLQAQAQFPTPDLNFGTNGQVISDFFLQDDVANDIVVQPDGTLVVTGYSRENSHRTFMVARYNANGTADSSFGINGHMNSWIVNANNVATSVALQPDGKIVVAGYFDSNNYNDPMVMRLTANGIPDNTFGTGGFVPFWLNGQFDEFHDITMQADGKILAAGRRWINNSYDFAVVRLLSDGTPDASFGTNGWVTTDFNGAYENIYSLTVQPDNKILVSGYKEPGSIYFAAARYLSDGTPDVTFGTAGKVVLSSGSRVDKAYGMTLQPNGKIVLAGNHHDGAINEYMIARLNADGSTDNGFGTGGFTYLPTQDPTDVITDVAMQADGKIVLSGGNSGSDALLVRLLTDGTADNAFGNNGLYTGNSAGSFNWLNSLVVMPDQSIVGYGVTQPGINFDFLLAKVLTVAPTGIEDPAVISGINIYPNPAQDHFQVSFDEPMEKTVELKMYDYTGKLVFKKSFDSLFSPVTIAMPENLRNGMFAVEFTSGATRITEIIMVSK